MADVRHTVTGISIELFFVGKSLSKSVKTYPGHCTYWAVATKENSKSTTSLQYYLVNPPQLYEFQGYPKILVHIQSVIGFNLVQRSIVGVHGGGVDEKRIIARLT